MIQFSKSSSRNLIESEYRLGRPSDVFGSEVKSGNYFFLVDHGRMVVGSETRRSVLSDGMLGFIPSGWVFAREFLGQEVGFWTIRIRHHLFALDQPVDMAGFSVMRHLARYVVLRGARLPIGSATGELLRQLAASMSAQWSGVSSSCGDVILKGLGLQWLGVLGQDRRLFRRLERLGATDLNLDRLKPVLWYLESHFTEPVTVADLAGQAHLSRSHFQQLFKDQIGIPVMAYVMRLRVSRAAILLLTTDQSILEIAMASGFGTSSRFYEAFGQIMGTSPGRYRRQGR